MDEPRCAKCGRRTEVWTDGCRACEQPEQPGQPTHAEQVEEWAKLHYTIGTLKRFLEKVPPELRGDLRRQAETLRTVARDLDRAADVLDEVYTAEADRGV